VTVTGKDNFIFGIHPVLEAIKSGKDLDRILLQKNLRGVTFRELFSLIRKLGIPFQFVPVEKLNRLSKQNHQGVIGWVAEITYQKIEDLLPGIFEAGRLPLIMVLEGITDVRNLGAIARTAECAGVDALIIPAQGSAQINSEAIKTSAGALYKIPVCRVSSLATTIGFLKDSGLIIVSATVAGNQDYTSVNMVRPLALIVGSESRGVSAEIKKLSDELVGIPLAGEIDSLNVSVAAGVLLFEIHRQRK